MKIAACDMQTKTFWLVEASEQTIRRYDNGCLVSIGWMVGTDLPRETFKRMRKQRIDWAAWTHRGCTTRCRERGDQACAW